MCADVPATLHRTYYVSQIKAANNALELRFWSARYWPQTPFASVNTEPLLELPKLLFGTLRNADVRPGSVVVSSASAQHGDRQLPRLYSLRRLNFNVGAYRLVA